MRVELQQQDVAWGDTVRFSCQVRGKPTPTVVWLHNSQPLSPSPRHRVTSQVLRVLHVGPQDDGMYQCMAENGVGSSQAATRLLTVPTGIKHFIKNHYYYYYFFSFIYFNFIQFFKILFQCPHDQVSCPWFDRWAQIKCCGNSHLWSLWPPVQFCLSTALRSESPPPKLQSSRVSRAQEGPTTMNLPGNPVMMEEHLCWSMSSSTERYNTVQFICTVWSASFHSTICLSCDSIPLIYCVSFSVWQAGESPGEWTTNTISGSQNKLTLTKLLPASLYEVEMAAKNCAGLGQPAMMTFRTGKCIQPFS